MSAPVSLVLSSFFPFPRFFSLLFLLRAPLLSTYVVIVLVYNGAYGRSRTRPIGDRGLLLRITGAVPCCEHPEPQGSILLLWLAVAGRGWPGLSSDGLLLCRGQLKSTIRAERRRWLARPAKEPAKWQPTEIQKQTQRKTRPERKSLWDTRRDATRRGSMSLPTRGRVASATSQGKGPGCPACMKKSWQDGMPARLTARQRRRRIASPVSPALRRSAATSKRHQQRCIISV